MNELASVGVILLLALLAGHVVRFLRIPEVTGYLLAGIAFGPSVLGWITSGNVAALEVLSEVALGLILFSIGTIFELDQFQRNGRSLAIITICESLCTAVLVIGAVFLTGQPWYTAVLLGVMAIETAAASTLMVLREYNAHGPLTKTLTGVFALDNLLCLFGFNIVVTIIQFTHAGGGNPGPPSIAVARLAWQFLGAIALGYVIGFLLSAWSTHVIEHGEQLILLAGCVLLCVGASKLLDVSSLVANLTIGATVVNLSTRSRRLFESLSQTDPPLYAIFFVLAGADLDITRLPSLGLVGVVYVIARIVGKYVGTKTGAGIAVLDPKPREWLPPSMFAQAGLAVGLCLTLTQTLPDLADSVTTVVLSAVVIFEIIGPLLVRRSLLKTGESQGRGEPAAERAQVMST